MVTRRKYRQRADVAPPAVDEPAAPVAASPVEPTMADATDDASPFRHALEAQAHAEQLQHQHAVRAQIGLPEPALDPQQRQAVDQHIDSLSVSDHWKRFLKSHPSLLLPPYHASMMHQYQLALNAGVPDSTDQMDRAILIGIARDIEHHGHLRALTSARPPEQPAPSPAANGGDVDQDAADLQAEAERHMTQHHRPAPVALSPSPQQRRSMPLSAPPSRDMPLASGHRNEINSLTADERQIAHNSFTDPNMSPAQKEYLYLQNKRKLHRMRADGTYSEQRGG